ncbi:hypothetical protein Bp8pS_185 [Bacillus phage vB_BpuM-BpSp]|nr:hypothetical protein Bp8pS_185 [Bacillus phage vB_BpuM-BpSp]
MISNFRKYHSDKNKERFNEELIYNKGNEDILKYLDPICRTLEIIPEINYKGATIERINKVYNFSKRVKPEPPKKEKDGKRKEKEPKREKVEIDIEESEFQLIKLNFEIDKKDDGTVTKIEKRLFFPKLIDSQYFVINNNRYYPIYQMLDSGTYRTNKALTLKTLLMPIVLREKKVSFDDSEGNTYNLMEVDLDLFKHKIPFLTYYLANFGYHETIKYFGYDDQIHLIQKEDLDLMEDNDNTVTFMITKNIALVVNKELLEDKTHHIFVGTLMKCFNSRIKFEKIFESDYWVKKLGGNFTTNNSDKQEKGLSILLSFRRILDDWTKEVLRTEPENKEDSYAVIRWMTKNYLDLIKQDNMNLANKRLRLYEYLLHPLLYKFSTGTYRVLNNKTEKYRKILTIFSNIDEGFLINKIVNNALLRYDNSVNSVSLFPLVLKYTMSGPQSPFNSNNVNDRYRGLHPSYLGRISLTSTSAGDPGVSGVLSPFLKLPEDANMHFTKKPEIELE